MVNSKLVQTRTKVNTKAKNSTAHVTYLSFLYSELFTSAWNRKAIVFEPRGMVLSSNFPAPDD